MLAAFQAIEWTSFDSPFDYPTQARLYLPGHLPLPTDEGWLPALVETEGPLQRFADLRMVVYEPADLLANAREASGAYLDNPIVGDRFGAAMAAWAWQQLMK